MNTEKPVTHMGICNCCGYEPVELLTFKANPSSLYYAAENRTMDLCKLCACSYASVAFEGMRPELPILAQINYSANAILDAIRSALGNA